MSFQLDCQFHEDTDCICYVCAVAIAPRTFPNTSESLIVIAKQKFKGTSDDYIQMFEYSSHESMCFVFYERENWGQRMKLQEDCVLTQCNTNIQKRENPSFNPLSKSAML